MRGKLASLLCLALLLTLPAESAAQTSMDASGMGSVIVGYDSRDCDDSIEGAVRYNSSTSTLQVCQPYESNSCPDIGDRCSDDSIYAGTTVGGARMYVAPCDHGMTWDGTDCTGSQTMRQWKTSTTTTSGTGSDTDGIANTDAMATAGLADHPAAEACRNMGSEWYLPARDELNTIYNNLVDGAPDGDGDDFTDDFFFNISGSFPAGFYWSSSEDLNVTARRQRFSVGSQSSNSKNTGLAVRCVRREEAGGASDYEWTNWGE